MAAELLIQRFATDKQDAIAMVYEYIDTVTDTLGTLPLFHVCISDSEVQVIFNDPTLAEMQAHYPNMNGGEEELDNAA